MIDHRCSFDQLGQVSGLDEQNSLNALDELLSARMIRENRTDKGKRVRGLVISDGYDRKFQLAAASVPDLHHIELSTIADPLGL